MLTSKQLNQKIAAFGKTTAAMREDMQTILVNAAAHAYQHGDVTFFDRLFENASGVNRLRATEWVREFGFATLSKDGKFKFNRDARAKFDFKDGLECYNWLQLNARPWWSKEEDMGDIAKKLDVAARIKSLASQIKNAANKNTEVTIDASEINAAMAMLKEAILAEVSAPATVDTAARIAA